MKNKFLTLLIFIIISLLLTAAVSATDEEITEYVPSRAYQDGYFDTDEDVEMYEAIKALEEISLFSDAVFPKEEFEAAVKNAWENRADFVDISSYSLSEPDAHVIYEYYWAFLNNSPEYFYVSGDVGYSYDKTTMMLTKLRIMYNYDIDVIPEMIEVFNEKTDYILSTLEEGMSDFDIALALHEHIVISSAYDEDEYNYYLSGKGVNNKSAFNAYGIIVDNKAVCEGYALAYNYLLGKCGIEAYYINSKEIRHGWTLAKIDGEFYHIDLTWNDPIPDRKGLSSYTYFMLSDSEMQALHAKKHPGKACDYVSKYIGDFEANATLDANSFVRLADGNIVRYNSNYFFTDYALKENGTNNITEIYIKSCPIDQPANITTVKKISGNEVYYRIIDETQPDKSVSITSTAMRVILFLHNGEVYYNTPKKIYKLVDGINDNTVVELASTYGFFAMEMVENTGDIYFRVRTHTKTADSKHVYTYSSKLHIDEECFVNGNLTLTENIVEPKDTAYGYTEYVCSHCQNSVIDETTYVNPNKYMPGDLDGDSVINLNDAVTIARIIAGWNNYTNSEYIFNADVNGDGKTDLSDTVYLARFLAGWPGYTL